MNHPPRQLPGSVSITRRVRGIVSIDCRVHPWGQCFLAETSWAGDPTPRPDPLWHAYLTASGAIGLLGPHVGRETPQFQTGIRTRVRNRLRSTINTKNFSNTSPEDLAHDTHTH